MMNDHLRYFAMAFDAIDTALNNVEWSGPSVLTCPSCHAHISGEHRPDCDIRISRDWIAQSRRIIAEGLK